MRICFSTFVFASSLLNKKPAPRSQGTTVLINKIFSTLPVRRSELLRFALSYDYLLYSVVGRIVLICQFVMLQIH